MKYVFINIHGTFDKNSKFIREDSTFSQTLKKSIGDVVFYPFDWSGKNSVKERYKCGIELKELIRKLSGEHPDRQLVLIAHSHGGNIIRHALADRDLQNKIHKIVFLATPFFSLQKVKQIAASNYIVDVFTISFYIFILVYLAIAVGIASSLRNSLGVVLILISPGFVLLIDYYHRKIIPKLAVWNRLLIERINRMIDEQSVIESTEIPILAVAYDVDEAKTWLVFVEFISRSYLKLTTFLYSKLVNNPLSNTVEKTSEKIMPTLNYLIVMLFIGIIGFAVRTPPEDTDTGALFFAWLIAVLLYRPFFNRFSFIRNFDISTRFSAFFFILFKLIYVPITFLIHPFGLLSKYNSIGYGRANYWDFIFLDISVVNIHNVHSNASKIQYKIRNYIRENGLRKFLSRYLKNQLFHSEVYENTAIISDIAAWVVSTKMNRPDEERFISQDNA